jgi:hypothetical protein
MKNAFARIWNTNDFQTKDRNYVAVAMRGMNDTIAYIKTTTLPEDIKTYMIA